MEKYAYITNPYNGMSISTKSIQGKSIINTFNTFNTYTNQKGGALLVGSIGAVVVVGGLFAYSLFFKVSSDDPKYTEDQKRLLFISKIIADPNSSNKDIESSLQQCNTIISYYYTSIQNINENIRNIQYSVNKDKV